MVPRLARGREFGGVFVGKNSISKIRSHRIRQAKKKARDAKKRQPVKK
jgi:hypothetical protein